MTQRRQTDPAEVVMPNHVYGFPGVGFGGYAAGILSRKLSGDSIKVSFRRPMPLGFPVGLRATADYGYELADAEGTLLTAQECETVDSPPSVPSWGDALTAEKQHPLTDSPFYRGDCFGCGGDRTLGQGLRQTFSLLPEQSLVATTWTPDPELAPGSDELPAEHIWGPSTAPVVGPAACSATRRTRP
jgi:hypothetical protein